MPTSGDLQPTRQALEEARRQADHYARVAARLLYDGREADARLYAARYARAASEADQLNTAAARAEASPQDGP